MRRHAGKVAILTGTGCGPVMAQRFVEESARVLLSARRENLSIVAVLALFLPATRAGPSPAGPSTATRAA